MKDVIAKSKYIRISPRKLGLVASVLRGLPIVKAEEILAGLNKKGAKFLLLTLKQGIANATKNFDLDKDTLIIKEVQVNKGPTYKRGRPAARGQMHPILKRTSHIRMIISGEPKVKEPVKTVKKIKKTSKITKAIKKVTKRESK